MNCKISNHVWPSSVDDVSDIFTIWVFVNPSADKGILLCSLVIYMYFPGSTTFTEGVTEVAKSGEFTSIHLSYTIQAIKLTKAVKLIICTTPSLFMVIKAIKHYYYVWTDQNNANFPVYWRLQNTKQTYFAFVLMICTSNKHREKQSEFCLWRYCKDSLNRLRKENIGHDCRPWLCWIHRTIILLTRDFVTSTHASLTSNSHN